MSPVQLLLNEDPIFVTQETILEQTYFTSIID
jgi:hypothetical protein